MKKNFSQGSAITIIMMALVIASCNDDEVGTKLKARFDSEMDGKKVTFYNLTDTTQSRTLTYVWDFGDGETSGNESPTHTYFANGSYIVTLTASGEAESDESRAVVEISNITIDGDLSDWEDVPALAFDGEGTFKEVKVENLANQKLFFYILATSEASSFLDFYLNLDYEKTITGVSDTTGFFTKAYGQSNLGWDVLFEGFFGHTSARENLSGMFYGTFYTDDEDNVFSNNAAFSPANLGFTAGQISFTDVKESEGLIGYEFSVDLTSFPASLQPGQGDKIQFFMDEWINSPESTDGWWTSFIGHYPTGQNTAESEAATYTLK